MKKLTLLVAGLAIVMAGLTEALAQKKGKPLYTFPLGVQAYTYRAHFPKDVAGTLDRIQSLGITEIEGGAPKGMTPEGSLTIPTAVGTVVVTKLGTDGKPIKVSLNRHRELSLI